jgi:hypothetical protein
MAEAPKALGNARPTLFGRDPSIRELTLQGGGP